jgi:hypothetical protein
MNCEHHWDLDQIPLQDLVNLVNIDIPTLATSVSDSIDLNFVKHCIRVELLCCNYILNRSIDTFFFLIVLSDELLCDVCIHLFHLWGLRSKCGTVLCNIQGKTSTAQFRITV